MRVLNIPVQDNYEFINLDDIRVKSATLTGPEDKRYMTIVVEASYGREHNEEYFKVYKIGDHVPHLPLYPETINVKDGNSIIRMCYFIGSRAHLNSINSKSFIINAEDKENRCCAFLAEVPEGEDFSGDMFKTMKETMYHTRSIYSSNSLTKGLIQDGVCHYTPAYAFNAYVDILTRLIFVTKSQHVEVFISRLDPTLSDYVSTEIADGALYLNIKGYIPKGSMLKLVKSVTNKYKTYIAGIGNPQEYKFSGLYLTNVEDIQENCQHHWLSISSEGDIHLATVPITPVDDDGEMVAAELIGHRKIVMFLTAVDVKSERRIMMYYGMFNTENAEMLRKAITEGNLETYRRFPKAIDVTDIMALTLGKVSEDMENMFVFYRDVMLND